MRHVKQDYQEWTDMEKVVDATDSVCVKIIGLG